MGTTHCCCPRLSPEQVDGCRPRTPCVLLLTRQSLLTIHSSLSAPGFEVYTGKSHLSDTIRFHLVSVLRTTVARSSGVCAEGSSPPGVDRIFNDHLQQCCQTMHRDRRIHQRRVANPALCSRLNRESETMSNELVTRPTSYLRQKPMFDASIFLLLVFWRKKAVDYHSREYHAIKVVTEMIHLTSKR